MLELPEQPMLDKTLLVGGCLRLPLRFNAERLADEVASLPQRFWGTTAGRVGVHRGVEGVFLRGYAPAQGNLPIEDRPALSFLPYVNSVLRNAIPAPPLRCLLARLAGGAIVPMHIDRAPYFSQTLRLHIAITSHERALMHCAGKCYVMLPGELWTINNSAPHGVWNADPTRERTHLICDFLPTPALIALLAQGDRELGKLRPEVAARICGEPHLELADQGAAGDRVDQ